MRKVAVVGSGMGGLCIALILKKNGFEPTIFEANDRPGGSFWSYEKDGYRVDTGLHMLTRGTTGELPVLMKKYISPDVFRKRFVAQKCYKFYIGDKGKPLPMNLPSLMKFDLLSMKERMAFLRLFVHMLRVGREGTQKYGPITSYEHIKDYVVSDRMLDLLNALCWMSTGCNIKEGALVRFVDTFVRQKRLTAGYVAKHLLPHAKASEEDWYPVGGLKAVPELFIRQGLDVRLKSKVDRIIVENRKVKGVVVNGERHEADIVIYDGKVRDLPKVLEGGSYEGPVPKYDEYKATTIWLGFDSEVADWQRESRIRVMPGLQSPHWGVFISDFDSSAAPHNHQLFGMSAITHGSLKELVDSMRQSIEKLLPNYEKHRDMEYVQVCRAEKTLQRADNAMWFLPEQRTNIQGLYLVGTDTKGFGSGGTLCADSANRCWSFIQQDMR